MYEERNSTVARVGPERSLLDLLPNRLFAIGDSEPAPLASGVVVGRVLAVQPAGAFTVSDGDGDGTEVSFDHPEAWWRLVTATIAVERALGEPAPGAELEIVLPLDGSADPAKFSADVLAMGTVIVVLGEQGALRAVPEGFPVYWDGVFLAPVASDGQFSFGALGAEEAEFSGGIRTVDALFEAAAQPAEIVNVPTL